MIYQEYIDAVDSTHNVGRVLVPGPVSPASAHFLHHVSAQECRLVECDAWLRANLQHIGTEYLLATHSKTYSITGIYYSVIAVNIDGLIVGTNIGHTVS